MKRIDKYGLVLYKQTHIEQKDKGTKVAAKFVDELFCLIAKYCTLFYKNGNAIYDFEDMPYDSTERRLDAVLLPALFKLCNSVVMTELPTNRKISKQEYSGRIDYWCIYEGYSIVIELKQGYDNPTTPKTRQNSVLTRWKTMIEQLESIKEDLQEYGETTHGVIRIGLHVILSVQDIDPTEYKPREFNEELIEKTANRFDKHIREFIPNHKPDLIHCWKIPSRIVETCSATYPALWCLSKIYPAIKHKRVK